jgi:PAS domain S-box-containing protein
MKKASSSTAAKKAAKRSSRPEGHWISKDDMAALQDRLREAQETLEAIRNGEVDAVVVNGSHGSHVYSLSGAEQPYRVYVEQMQEGAVTVSAEGVILYSNQRFAEMTGLPLERVISSSLRDLVSPALWEKISAVLQEEVEAVKHEDQLQTREGDSLAVSFTASRLPLEDQSVICLVVTDLSLLREQ